jgi:DNA-binding NarL/FixJ family response regulator
VSPPLRIVVVEDDPRFRASIDLLLSRAGGVAVAASFGNARAALDFCAQQPPPCDLVLMDLELPEMSGVEATRAFKAAGATPLVVILTVFEDPATILEAICAGADGYLLKTTSAPELLRQLLSISSGGAPLSAGVASSVLDLLRRFGSSERTTAPTRFDLSVREQEVLRGLVRGESYKGVAADLDVSLDTVRSHVKSIYRKLQVHSVAAAITRAIRDGLV